MQPERFTGEIRSGHKEAAVEVPFDPAQRWDLPASPLRPGRRGWFVDASLGGDEFSSVIVPRGGRFWLVLDNEQLSASGVSVGDRVALSLRPARR
ncbi:MAG: DUF1905 domain-containing protein [Dokdonella sp.]